MKYVSRLTYFCMYFTEGACDNFLSEQLEVHFPAGASAVMVPINITNDDVFEFSRTYNVLIDEEMLPDYVVVGDPDLVTIVLREDDNSKQFLLSSLCCYLHLISTI